MLFHCAAVRGVCCNNISTAIDGLMALSSFKRGDSLADIVTMTSISRNQL